MLYTKDVVKQIIPQEDVAKVIENATKLILPGVGHFNNGIKNLKERGIWDVLNKKVLGEKTHLSESVRAQAMLSRSARTKLMRHVEGCVLHFVPRESQCSHNV